MKQNQRHRIADVSLGGGASCRVIIILGGNLVPRNFEKARRRRICRARRVASKWLRLLIKLP